MRKIFERNAILKAISFIVAVTLWLYIAIVVNPSVDAVIRDIPVDFIGEEHLTRTGLSVIGEKDNKVEIKIRGNRSTCFDLNSENIVATADLSQVNEAGRYQIPITVTLPVDKIDIVHKRPYSLDVNVDKLAEKRINIRMDTTGSVKSGFIHYETKITPSSVLISGSEKVVNEVTDAAVEVDYGDASSDISGTAKVSLYDTYGNEVRSNLIFKDVDEVNVYCRIGELKTVNIVPNFIRPSKDPVLLSPRNLTLLPSTITIYGTPEAIKKVDKLYTEPITVEHLGEDFEATAAIKAPQGVYFRDDVKEVDVKYSAK
jgi:YbbR domain-containing protein